MTSFRFIVFFALSSLVGVAAAADGYVERSYALRGHGGEVRTASVVPTQGGGLVTWGGQF